MIFSVCNHIFFTHVSQEFKAKVIAILNEACVPADCKHFSIYGLACTCSLLPLFLLTRKLAVLQNQNCKLLLLDYRFQKYSYQDAEANIGPKRDENGECRRLHNESSCLHINKSSKSFSYKMCYSLCTNFPLLLRECNTMYQYYEYKSSTLNYLKKINQNCGLQLPMEPHRSTRLLQLTGTLNYLCIKNSVQSIEVGQNMVPSSNLGTQSREFSGIFSGISRFPNFIPQTHFSSTSPLPFMSFMVIKIDLLASTGD